MPIPSGTLPQFLGPCFGLPLSLMIVIIMPQHYLLLKMIGSRDEIRRERRDEFSLSPSFDFGSSFSLFHQAPDKDPIIWFGRKMNKQNTKQNILSLFLLSCC